MIVLLIYGGFFNGLLMSLRTDGFSFRKIFATIAAGFIFVMFYFIILILTYVFFRIPKGAFIRGEFYTVLPTSPWSWIGMIMLLAILLGFSFFLCHEILLRKKIKRHVTLFFFHLLFVLLLTLLFYSFGIQLFYEHGDINLGKQILLGCATFIISFLHLVGVMKIHSFVTHVKEAEDFSIFKK